MNYAEVYVIKSKKNHQQECILKAVRLGKRSNTHINCVVRKVQQMVERNVSM